MSSIVNGPNAFRRTPLHDAVVAGSLPLVDLLIKQGADPNLADTNGSTALHLACQSEKKHAYEIVSRLIRGGAFVEALDKRGQTPLQIALVGRCTQAAEELVQYGADPRILAFMDKRTTPLELRSHLLTVAYSSVEQMVRIKLRHELKAVPLDLTLLDQCPRDGAKFGVLRKKYHCGCKHHFTLFCDHPSLCRFVDTFIMCRLT
jgi:ankyrin repeat protein